MAVRLVVLVFLLLQSALTLQAPTCERKLLWQNELARLAAILETLPSDLDKTIYLRIYSGELIDIGLPDKQTIRLFESTNFVSFSLSDFYELFKRNRIPGTCGITTYFYIKLLQRFGFKAYQYSFGFTQEPYDRFIHSVALVEIVFKGTRRLIVQDPYLNLTYRNLNGEPIDFFDFLSLIKQKKYGSVLRDSASLTTSLIISDPSIYDQNLDGECKTLFWQKIGLDGGTFRSEIPISRDYSTLMQSRCGNFENGFIKALRDHGYDEPLVYAYVLRASEMVGDSDYLEVQRKIDAALR